MPLDHNTPPAVLNGMLAVIAHSNTTGQRAYAPNELHTTAGVQPDWVWDVIGQLPERIAGPSMELWAAHYDARSQRDALEDGYLSPPVSKPKRRYVPAGIGRTDLRSIPAERYVKALTGLDVTDGGRRALCPLPDHPDRHPDFSVRGAVWRCFGCGRGGDIFDLAAEVWNRPVRSRMDFGRLARELEDRLGRS